MPMLRDDARPLVQRKAQTDSSPALSDEELEDALDAAQCVDANGVVPGGSGYVDTVWVARAVVVALETRLLKAVHLVDFTADGSMVAQSQVVANLKAARDRADSLCLWGTP